MDVGLVPGSASSRLAARVVVLTLAGCSPNIGNTDPDATTLADAPPDAQPDAPPNAVTVSFGETGTATFSNVTADAEINVGGNLPRGGGDHTSVELANDLALYRFDISAIPSSATVIDARIDLSTIGDGSLLLTGSAHVYRLLETWDEASMTYFVRSTGLAWSTMGASAPGSRDPTALGSFVPTAEGQYSVTLAPSVVQGWLASPSTNAGFIVDTDGTGHLHLGAREGVAAQAAVLVVTYLP